MHIETFRWGRTVQNQGLRAHRDCSMSCHRYGSNMASEMMHSDLYSEWLAQRSHSGLGRSRTAHGKGWPRPKLHFRQRSRCGNENGEFVSSAGMRWWFGWCCDIMRDDPMPKTGSHESPCSPLHKCAINRNLLPKGPTGWRNRIVAFHCFQGKFFGLRNLLLESREPTKPAFPLKIRVPIYGCMPILKKFILMSLKFFYYHYFQ